MKKSFTKMIRGISSMLAAVMATTVCPIVAYADEDQPYDFEVDGLRFNIISEEEKTCELTFNTDTFYPGDIVVPEIANGYTVAKLGLYAFYCCYDLTSVSIPQTVTEYGEWCFVDTKLKNIDISKNVTTIYGNTFDGNKELEAFNVENDNPNYKSVDGVLFRRDMKTLLMAPCKLSGTYYIPDTVENLANNAFAFCKLLEEVYIPESVTYMEASMFIDCTSLRKVKLPSSLTSIPPATFSNCKSLVEVVIPERVETIGFGAFGACESLKEITLPLNLKTMDWGVFKGCCSLEKVVFNKSLQSIGAWSFQNCSSLKAVTLPVSLEVMEEDIFSGCSSLEEINVEEGNNNFVSENGILFSADMATLIVFPVGRNLKEYIVPGSVEIIGGGAFRSSSLERITMTSVKEIQPYGFAACESLAIISFGDLLETIGYDAFYKCPKIRTINLPATVSYIGDTAFGRCTGLESITVLNSVPPVVGEDEDVFDQETLASASLYVPESAIVDYKTADVWKNFVSILPLESGIESINPESASHDAVWFNIYGQRVQTPVSDPGIYLIHKNGKMEKILIK